MTSGHGRASARRHRTVLSAVATLLALATVWLPGRPADGADDPQLRDTFPVAPGLVRQLYDWQTPGGPQSLQLLRFRLDDERVDLEPELANGVVPGREPVDDTVLRLGEDAVAGVNGGFWLDDPDGDPEGLVVREGRYVSEPQGAGPRAAFALFPDDTYAIGRPEYAGDVCPPDHHQFGCLKLAGINRQPRPADDHQQGEVVAFSADYAPHTGTAGDTIEVVFDVDLDLTTLGNYPVVEVRHGGDGVLRPGQTVLAARGVPAYRLENLQPGDYVTFDLRATVDWRDAWEGLAAGPLIVQDGQAVPRDEWASEGFEHKVHNDVAHPRTAIGFTADGEVLLVTVDGRQPGRAVGLTTEETAALMLRLGAVDALMLDGGGSTTMVTDGRVQNVPSDGFARWVSNSLVLRTTVPTPGVTRFAGTNRWETAAEVARSGWPDGSRRALLASGRAFPDGLAGGPLAARWEVPLLLTEPSSLPAETAQALADLGVEEVTVLGGPVAVADEVLDELRADGIQAERLAGDDRAHTAALIADELGAPTGRAFLASGWGFADALAAIAPAYAAQAPLLLTGADAPPDATLAALEDLGVDEVVVAGGPAVIHDSVLDALRERGLTVTRVAGPDRFATAARLVAWAEDVAGLAPTGVTVASGEHFPDALSGGPFAVLHGAPIVLVRHAAVARSGEVSDWLGDHTPEHGFILGGRLAVSTWVAHELQAAVDR